MDFRLKLKPSWSHVGFQKPSKKQTAKTCKNTTAPQRELNFARFGGPKLGAKTIKNGDQHLSKNETSSGLVFGSIFGGFGSDLGGGVGAMLAPIGSKLGPDLKK